MTRRNRYRAEGFKANDWKVMEDHYEKMAKRGLFIQRSKWGFSVYKEGSPRSEKYSVGVYPRPRAFEVPDKVKVEEYVREQEDKGWIHVYSQDHIHVFRSREENLPPVNRSTQVDSIRKGILLENISFISLIALNIFNMRRGWPMPASSFYTNLGIAVMLLLPLISLVLIITVIENMRLWLHIKDRSKTEDFPQMNTTAVLLSRKIQFVGSGLILLLLIVGLLADSFLSGNLVILTILPITLGIFVAFKMRKFFQGRGMDAFQKTLISFAVVFISVGIGTVITMRTVPSGFGEGLPEGKHALRFEESTDQMSYRREGSIIVPERYVYSEYRESERVSTEVSGFLTENLAERIYPMVLEDNTRYIGEYWSAENWYPQYDQAHFVTMWNQEMDGGGILILKKDNYIMKFIMEEDLRKPEVSGTIEKTVDRIIKDS